MKLQDLLAAISPLRVEGPTDQEITQIDFDSRKAGTGSLFVAVKGLHFDGHAFIGQVAQQGTKAIVVQSWPDNLPEHITCIAVEDSAAALGILAARFFGNPSANLKLVGVTGTNGKTTTATLLHDLTRKLGYSCGLISTIENRIDDEVMPALYTTPDAVAVNKLLAEMVAHGCSYAFMEVSSHAIDQKRVEGLEFAGAVFTNISHDHLDYHKTFDNYIRAKKGLFDELSREAFALVNVDDRRGMVMVQNTRAKIFRYGLKSPADFKAKLLENSLEGLQLDLDGFDFHALLVGEFNAYNLLAVYAVAVLLGHDKTEVLTALSQLKPAEGRFDLIYQAKNQITAVVDYAHTPDALEKILQTLNKLRRGNGRILTVVGCGGDRDKAKRPLMAKAACEWSSQVILTSDNPRSEDPQAILTDMEVGVPISDASKVLTIADRKQAIRTACTLARSGDIILVAGKGHEKYQEIKGVRYPFDDKEEVQMAFNQLNSSKP